MEISIKDYSFKDDIDFHKWRTSFTPDIRVRNDEHAALYTDGDDGVMQIEMFSEVFEYDGVTFSLVDCQYCDIDYQGIHAVLELLEGESRKNTQRLNLVN